MTIAMELAAALILVLLAKAIVSAVQRFHQGFVSLGSCPGRHFLWLHPFSIIGLVMAPIFPSKGWLGHYGGKFSLYAKEGSTILSGLLVWSSTPIFWLADVEAIKVVTSDRHTFKKHLDAYEPVNIYGKNIVSTEGTEWRKHLGIAGPAFSEANYSLTWRETLRVVHEWFEEMNDVDTGKLRKIVRGVDVKAKMTQATLHIIAAAGFGMRMPWEAFSESKSQVSESLHASDPLEIGILPFHTALSSTIEKLFINTLAPSFLHNLPFRVPWISAQLDAAHHSFASLKAHMTELVAAVRRGEKGGSDYGENEIDTGADLLRRLVQASDATKRDGSGGKGTLTDGELFSNIFTFLLAGHETSAHTLSFAIMLLALYPDIQSKLREEALRVWPTDDDVTSSTFKRDFDKFEYTLAFFRETLRCFPSEPRLLKTTDADAILSGTRFSPTPGTSMREPESSYDGGHTNVQFLLDDASQEKFAVHIPRGSMLMMDVWAVHMSPLVWGSDAHTFLPERFIDTANYKWPRDGLLAFSAGARGCIGNRFATTEAVCLLASLVRQYEILFPTDCHRPTDVVSQGLKREMLKWSNALTLTPTNAFVELRVNLDSEK
ncbi:cytochrome P450 [Phellopilus nigrolimitatus]|nr:cytochrome P450 [Phellopilus nigrolimitatus]